MNKKKKVKKRASSKQKKRVSGSKRFLSCRSSPERKRNLASKGLNFNISNYSNLNKKMVERLSKQISFAEQLISSKRELEGEIKNIHIPNGRYYISKLLKSLNKEECYLDKKQFFNHFLETINAIKYALSLKVPSITSIPKISFPWVKASTKKLLVLDLDETLIHSEYSEPEDLTDYQTIEFKLQNGESAKVSPLLNPLGLGHHQTVHKGIFEEFERVL